ncbi:MAG TPA: hypothetical protein PKM98_13190, partial [Chitinophagaceae bacterium]|nr:hypothetical protein [Chitinophagaceae bacterium]
GAALYAGIMIDTSLVFCDMDPCFMVSNMLMHYSTTDWIIGFDHKTMLHTFYIPVNNNYKIKI